jgi:predicted CXXCH cytochrome family protein
MTVPADLPLTGGRVSCTTCHDLQTGARPRLYGDGDLCVQCHAPSRADPGNIHALATSFAHPRSSPGDAWTARDWSAGPDPESSLCLSCHDGAMASLGDVRIGRAMGFTANRLIGGQHPIGVKQGPRGVGDNLRRADQIDPAIRLYDSRLGCGSCHSPYADNEMMLVIPNDRSRLCLACHDQ